MSNAQPSPGLWERVRYFIEARVPDGPFSVQDLAKKIQTEMALADPVLLEQWQYALSLSQISVYLSDHLRASRNSAARAARRLDTDARLAVAVTQGQFSLYYKPFVVDDDNTRVPAHLINRDGARYVMMKYQVSSRRDGLEAKFWAAIVNRLPDDFKVVEDIMDVETFLRLYQSITG